GEDLAEADIDQILALKDHEFLDETVPAGGGRSPRRRIVAVVRDTAREPVAALTITVDLNMWFAFQGIVEKMLVTLSDSPAAAPYPECAAPRSRDGHPLHLGDLAAELIEDAVSEVGIPVELMKKEHKTQVVRRLRDRGIFTLRDSVETVASALKVTRF